MEKTKTWQEEAREYVVLKQNELANMYYLAEKRKQFEMVNTYNLSKEDGLLLNQVFN